MYWTVDSVHLLIDCFTFNWYTMPMALYATVATHQLPESNRFLHIYCSMRRLLSLRAIDLLFEISHFGYVVLFPRLELCVCVPAESALIAVHVCVCWVCSSQIYVIGQRLAKSIGRFALARRTVSHATHFTSFLALQNNLRPSAFQIITPLPSKKKKNVAKRYFS